MNYYNEFDPKAAAWLRELIKQGHIPAGDVDERSIKDVKANELTKYTQCHFFAGIGGWSLALQLAGWPSDRPVWTGSCPCQPYSSAGKGLGDADPRNLWPSFFGLIGSVKPVVVFGEQVANAIGKGWLDGVSSDLEGAVYTCGAAVLGAHSVGAPHIRQRLYWVADTDGGYAGTERQQRSRQFRQQPDDGSSVRLGNANSAGSFSRRQTAETNGHGCSTVPDGGTVGMGNPDHPGSQGRQQCGDGAGELPAGSAGLDGWSNYDILPCTDGKSRRIESGTFPLAHGVPGRVGLLRGYGNAITPQCGAAFIQAYLEVTSK